MDSSNILKPTATISYSFINKFKRFLCAALLADWVLGNAINVFIENLNKKGLLGLGSDFQTNSMIWGDSIWVNALHILILAITAGVFGFIFGYLSRRVSTSDKIIFTTFYVFIRFIFLGIFSIIIENFLPDYASTWGEILSTSIFIISSSAFNATFVILGYVAMFASAFYFINKGSNIINDPYYNTDKSENGTLLDIKWYHYFWLFIPRHVEKGESIFTIEKGDGGLIFKIKTFSEPGNLVTKIVGPIFTVPYQAYCTRTALENVKRQILQ